MSEESGKMWIEYEPLDEVVRWPRNPKDHDIAEIGASFDRFGFADPFIKDEVTGQLLAGHGRLEALQEKQRAGEEPPGRVVVSQAGLWMVPVVRGVGFESTSEAEAFLLAHNQLTIKGGWNDAELDEMIKDQFERSQLDGMGFDPDQFFEDLPDLGLPDSIEMDPESEEYPEGEQEGEQEAGGSLETVEDIHDTLDDIPEVKAPVTARGDVWALGDHRLMCGDSQDREDVDLLMGGRKAAMVLTDPPYAIYGSSSGIGADIADDKMIRPFFLGLCSTIHRILSTFGHSYINCDWRSWATIWWAMNSNGLSPKNMIIWDKGKAGLGSSYMHCHELIAFSAKLPPAKAMQSSVRTGQRLVRASNIMRHNRVSNKSRQHNAAKPIQMLIDIIQNSSDPKDLVVDLFCGSGSTMIAAEECGRVCFTMDLEPKWVDVAVARWEKVTGRKAELVTGKPKRRRKKKSNG